MPIYIPRQIPIEARLFTPESRDDLISWCGARHTGMDEDGSVYETASLFIRTLEGEMRADPGDYIVKGIEGEFYPVKGRIFVKKYQLD